MASAATQTDQILNDLLGRADTSTKNLQERVERTGEIAARFSQLHQQLDDATKIRDEHLRTEKIRILEANLEELRAAAKIEEKDLAGAVFGLNSYIETLGSDFETLNELNAAEKAIVESAKQAVENAKNAMGEAQGKWNVYPGRRAGFVLAAAQNLRAAEQGVPAAEVEAKKRQKTRLQSADMATSMQEIQVRGQRIAQMLKAGREATITELAAVSAEKVRMLDGMVKAADAMVKFESLIQTKEAEVARAEERLGTLTNGTTEHADQTKVVSQLRAQLEELVGGRNVALVMHEESDKFSRALAMDEQTHIRHRDNMLMWLKALETDTEARVITFRSRLTAMQISAQQDAAKMIDDLGAAVDLNNVAAMAGMAAASDRARADRFRKAPGRRRDIDELLVASVQARSKVEAEMQQMIDDWRQEFGIDPMAAAYITHRNRGDGTPQAN